MGWITFDHFIAVLAAHGFEIRSEGDFIIITRGRDRYPYNPRSDRMVPPKTFRRFAYKYGVNIKEFVPPRLDE